MITGQVTPGNEPIVWLKIRGPVGVEFTVPTTVDTGFSEFVGLTPDFITALGLPFIINTTMTLADGSDIPVAVHEGTVVWDGQDVIVRIHVLDESPLIGMALMRDFILTVEAFPGGNITLVRAGGGVP
jgi:clan AA aspartic protease